MLKNSPHPRDEEKSSGGDYLDVERENSCQLADYTTLDTVDSLPREYENVPITKRVTASSTASQTSAKSHYQEVEFRRSSGENDYTSLVKKDKAAGSDPDGFETSTVFSTNRSEREDVRKEQGPGTSQAEGKEYKATLQASRDSGKKYAAQDFPAQGTTAEDASHASKDAANPRMFQQRHVRAVFACVLLSTLLISVCSGVVAAIALNRASSSSISVSGEHMQQVSTSPSKSTPTTIASGTTGEASISE